MATSTEPLSTPVGATRDSIAEVWGPRTPHTGEWPVRQDARVLEEPERWVPSVCVLCSTGCGMDVGVRDGRLEGNVRIKMPP